MSRLVTWRRVLFAVLIILTLSVALSVVSFFSSQDEGKQIVTIIDDSLKLTPQETYRQGLGSFHGDENITIFITENANSHVNFTLLTYTGPRFNSTQSNINYSFPAGADYYEAVFQTNSLASADVRFQVFVQKPDTEYPFSWLSTPSKALFLACWSSSIFLILKPIKAGSVFEQTTNPLTKDEVQKKNLQRLRIGVFISLAFWLLLLVLNSYPLATFENWYTDAARHPYTSTLFTKVGFSVFDTSLGKLSSLDSSVYKFVSWGEMPHLYPIGSVFLFLPFGALLEAGISQILVFKMQIAMLLVSSHVCLYLFLKRFWKQELNLTPKKVWSKPIWRHEFSFLLKVFGTYLLYVLLVVYSANGQFDAVAFLFLLVGIVFFVEGRQDYFLLFVAIACTFKYQAGIFLFPLAIVSVLQLIRTQKPKTVLRNKAVLAALALAGLDVVTAFLSSPFLLNVKPELVMNGVNAFSPHAQISWATQIFTVFVTLGITLVCALYLLNRSRLISLFMVFSLLPIFSMPYFQPWYLPVFFVYPLIPQSKRSLQVTLIWLIFITMVLSFGGLSYNPLSIFDNIRRIIKI